MKAGDRRLHRAFFSMLGHVLSTMFVLVFVPLWIVVRTVPSLISFWLRRLRSSKGAEQ